MVQFTCAIFHFSYDYFCLNFLYQTIFVANSLPSKEYTWRRAVIIAIIFLERCNSLAIRYLRKAEIFQIH